MTEIPLTCVRVVCQNGLNILQLPHIIAKLDGFLNNSWKWTLSQACALGSLDLVEKILLRLETGTSPRFKSRSYRQWQFGESLVEATNVGNLGIVQLLTPHFQGCYVSSQVMKNATVHGRFEILKWLVDCGCDVQWDAAVVVEAIRKGNFELVKWLKERLPRVFSEEMAAWAVIAASKGNLEISKWVCGMLTERDTDGHLRYFVCASDVEMRYILQYATNSGKLDVVKWILDEPNRNVLLYELSHSKPEGNPRIKVDLAWAACYGHVDVLAWLTQHHPDMCDDSCVDINAARNGCLDVLRLKPWSPDKRTASEAVHYAAKQGHLDVVKYLVSQGYSTDHAIDGAAENGYLDIVEWLHDNTPCTCTTNAMDNAATNGHLSVVKWLHRNRKEGCTVVAMDYAACYGYYRVVQWLHENRTEGCTVKAMDEVARSGNLEMVKWLHFNRSEGCTTSAMDSAAGNGHLDVVKWLHLNRLEGCTTEAMDKAAKNNHLEVLKWLDDNRTEGFTCEALSNAAERGNLKVLQWLFSRRFELCGTTLEDKFVRRLLYAAAWDGHFDVVWYLHQNCRECGSIQTLKNAFTALFVPSNYLFQFADWAYIHHRHEFQELLFADDVGGVEVNNFSPTFM